MKKTVRVIAEIKAGHRIKTEEKTLEIGTKKLLLLIRALNRTSTSLLSIELISGRIR